MRSCLAPRLCRPPPAVGLGPPPLPSPPLSSLPLSVERRPRPRQDTRCDSGAVAAGPRPPWPCCRPGVTSCLTLCLPRSSRRGPVAPAVAVTAPQQAPASGAPQARAAAVAAAASQPTQPPQTAVAVAPGGPAVAQEMQDNVKKCKNFLATLIKLASHNSPSPETSKNVKSLVQDLLDAKIEPPRKFTSRLQAELKSSPQPYLVPFLKKSLPALRLSLLSSQHSVPTPQQGVKPGVYPRPPGGGGGSGSGSTTPPASDRPRGRAGWRPHTQPAWYVVRTGRSVTH
ncbi:transcription initiation factor TFIID subunit 4-like [Gadus macrocephalus]|uniref:transcription initiation factor TFIID subunit 4-like n=1 Tax=Gadus macrocephalus TaxID=80720 RepID=UPI0028CB6217|nr:transcription initiation factor TFIID subunit 4-like [Gadus macrocephalus]